MDSAWTRLPRRSRALRSSPMVSAGSSTTSSEASQSRQRLSSEKASSEDRKPMPTFYQTDVRNQALTGHFRIQNRRFLLASLRSPGTPSQPSCTPLTHAFFLPPSRAPTPFPARPDNPVTAGDHAASRRTLTPFPARLDKPVTASRALSLLRISHSRL